LTTREELERSLHFLAPLLPKHPAVARAIELLDHIDGDADLEPDPESPEPFNCFYWPAARR
jgi:hypothetical protein